jgi:hypothetical protein
MMLRSFLRNSKHKQLHSPRRLAVSPASVPTTTSGPETRRRFFPAAKPPLACLVWGVGVGSRVLRRGGGRGTSRRGSSKALVLKAALFSSGTTAHP